MSKKKIILIVILIVAVITLTVWLIEKRQFFQEEIPITEENGIKYVSNQLIVKFSPDVSVEEINQIHRQIGGRVVTTIPQLKIEIVEVPAAKLKEKLKEYNMSSRVEYAELNHVMEIQPALEE